ncbi:hypothetical protein E4H12_09715 [Candidatus Thorarchaeota archaeon]|nr:MAG: hypothetical protein E4H12_09715 [Candidatus Thorarchaeota archaeon]
MFGRLQADSRALIKEVVQLVYFMRGGVTYEEMMRRTPGERSEISDFIEKRLEDESKKMNPVY